MEGQVELFSKARSFLASKGYARNVRIADIIAVMDAAVTGTINASQRLDSGYDNAGGYAGPLDNNGNMPTSSMGVIIGSAVVLPRRFVATEEVAMEQAYQAVTEDTSHLVSVAGTEVLARHSAFSGRFSGLELPVTNNAGAILYGAPGSAPPQTRTPEPTLVVGKGERVEQRLLVRRQIVLAAVTITPELVLLMVVADEGQD